MKKAATARQNGSRSQGNPTLRKNNEIRTWDIQGSNQHPNQEPNRPTDQAPGIGNGIGKGNGFNIGEGREGRAP
jgi:hypothetical protein